MYKRFEDLPVWQDALLFSADIYRITKDFPQSEVFGITSQMRRASSSVSANIAEGFGRKTSKDRVHFYHIALGSLNETKNFIYLAHKVDYLNEEVTDDLIQQSESLKRQITAILRELNK